MVEAVSEITITKQTQLVLFSTANLHSKVEILPLATSVCVFPPDEIEIGCPY